MRRAASLAAALLSLSSAAPAVAQAYSDPGFGLGVHMAFHRAADAASPFVAAGVHARYRVTGGLGLEALASVRKDELETNGERRLRLLEIPVMASAQLFFLYTRPVQPYLLAGAGYHYVRATGLGREAALGTDASSEFGFHAGAGVEARVGRQWSLHVDARRVFVKVTAADALGLSTDAWNVNLGVSLLY